MNQNEHQTPKKTENKIFEMIEENIPEEGTFMDDAEIIEIDRPTVYERECCGFPVYHAPKKMVAEDGEAEDTDSNEPATPNLPMVIDDPDGPDDEIHHRAEANGLTMKNQKTPMDFFNDFKAAYCLGEPVLFHTPEQQPVMSINVNGHYENIFLESRIFDRMCHYFSIKMNKQPACSTGCINNLRNILSTIAIFEGPELPLHVRYARQNDTVYIDLVSDTWQQVKVTAKGWEVIENIDSPVKFIRKKGMAAMPVPKNDFDLDTLRALLNVDDDDWRLLAAWLLGAMNPDGPFPILILQGQKGSAKTTTAKLLKDLIDPSDVNIQALPKSERDLVISANNSWVLNFDNLSGVSVGLADAFCRIATGSGFRARKLFTDDDESLFNIKRPVIMNGITDISRRSDFIDRSIIINMIAIPENGRLPETTLKSYWKDCKSSIFGHLCNALSAALSNYERITVGNLPRMADFAQWVTAGETAFGWEQGTFLNAYENARANMTEMTIEAEPIASAVISLMENHPKDTWTGNATQLLDTLELYADNRMIKSKDWPRAANVLSNRLQRSSADLRAKGISIEWGKSTYRFITIQRIGGDFTADKGRRCDDIEAMAWESGAI
jgi:hypothetical protein